MFKFIIVDNDSNIRNEITSIIDWERIGFRLVGSYADAEHALKTMETQNIDLVISNLYTMKLDGLTFASVVKNKYPSSKIIIYSSMVNYKPLLDAYKIKVDDFIKYPIDTSAFYFSIHHIKEQLSQIKETKRTIKLLKTRLNVLEKVHRNYESEQNKSDYISFKYFKENTNKYNVLLKGNVFCVAVVKTCNENQLVTEIKSPVCFSIYNVIESFMRMVENCIVVQSIYGNTVIIMSDITEEVLNRRFYNYLNALKSKVNLELGLDLCIGIGRNVHSLNNLLGSWKDAISATDYKYVLGNNNIISYGDVIRETDTQMNYSIINLEKKIVAEIHRNNFSDVVYHINLFFQNMRTNLYPLENYYYYVQHMIIAVRKALSKNSAISSKDIAEQFSVLSNCNFNYIDNDEELLITCLKKLMQSPVSRKIYSSENICKKAIDYIEKNYNNPELSLNMVCKHLALSVSYFSALFKNYSGTTFVEYLTNIRMEKAKELLTTTTHKSYQIAEKVGYNDPHYFSILFKKKTGLPPTKYKQTIHVKN